MKYRKEIDGLRAVAVLPVILFHAGFEAFSGGFVGVDVFFVISGYLITSIILSDMENGKFSIVTFYERRARRILPALFFVMLCSLPFAWLWLLPSHLKDFSQSLTAVAAFSSNILFWLETGYFGTASELKPLLHTWSLAIEEQYYMFFPLFLMALWKLRRRLIFGSLLFVGVISLIAAQWGAYNKPSATFFLLPTRGWELAIGALIAFYFLYKRDHVEFIREHKKVSEAFGAVGLALIIYSVFAFNQNTPFPSLYALVPTIGTGLIIAFSTSETVVGRFLGIGPMVGVGLISYSTYLWHQPLFVFTRHRSLTEPGTAFLLFLSVLSLALAYISWRYVEAPFRDKAIVSRGKVFSFAVVGSIFFASVGLAGHLMEGSPLRLDNAALELLSLKENSVAKRIKYQEEVTKALTTNKYSIIGISRDKPKFLIIGDSHAQALVSSFDNKGKNVEVSGIDMTYFSCPPLVNTEIFENFNQQKTCRNIREDFFTNLDKEDSTLPEYIVLSARWSILFERVRFNNREGGVEFGSSVKLINRQSSVVTEDILLKEIHNSVRKILDSGRKVILIYPIPEAGWVVPEMLAKSLFLGEKFGIKITTSYDVFKERNVKSYHALESIGYEKGLLRIYPEKFFCNTIEGRCLNSVESNPLYYDDDHLTQFGADFVVEEVFKITNNFTDIPE